MFPSTFQLFALLILIGAMFSYSNNPKSLMCKKRERMRLSYRKDLPWGEDIRRDVELDDITDGRPTVLALHTAHCLYCTTQAKYLGNMARDLIEYGVNISIVIINHPGYEEYIDYYMPHVKSFDHVYFLQDSYRPDRNAWRKLMGRKDDFYIYDSQQRLVKHVTGQTGSLTNFGWRDELYDLLSRMGEGDSPCDNETEEGDGDSKLKQLWKSEYNFPHGGQCQYISHNISNLLLLPNNTPTLVYLASSRSRYSVFQVRSIGKFVSAYNSKKQKKSSSYIGVVIVNMIGSEVSYAALKRDVERMLPYDNVHVVQDTVAENLALKLSLRKDDAVVFDSLGRVLLLTRSPKTDFLSSGWRELLDEVVSDDTELCTAYRYQELVCREGASWEYNGTPFSWMTFDRFTVVSVLKEGAEGVEQFEKVVKAREDMGYKPITHIAIRPTAASGDTDNLITLRSIHKQSRVYLVEDYTDPEESIVNKLLATPGDVYYYDKNRVLRGVERFSSRYDFMSRIRHFYRLQDQACST